MNEFRDLVDRDSSGATGKGNDWHVVESTFGSSLPSDYKRFVEQWGSPTINDTIYILSPFPPASPGRLLTEVERHAEILRWQMDESDGDIYPVGLSDHGLVTWGFTSTGDTLNWLTVGEPDAWPTVIVGRDLDDQVRFDCGMAEVLRLMLSGEVPVDFVYYDAEGNIPHDIKWELAPQL